LFVDHDAALIAIPPAVSVKSTVGAGDAMVAGVLAAQKQGLSLPDSARLATAFSLGRITRVGDDVPAPALLQEYVQQVTVRIRTDIHRNA
jgi:fructose-1-phosphate kinase PfkB-like protein